MPNLTPPSDIPLADPAAERARRSLANGIRELQRLPAAAIVVKPTEIPDGAYGTVLIAHGLGRPPLWVGVSVPTAPTALLAGTIVDPGSVDFAGNPIDRSKVVMLAATGWGRSIFVDVLFL